MAATSNITDQVISYLRANISQGTWPLGSRLPSEHQLCQTLGVSRTSVRSALQQLAAVGVVESVRGKGTYLRSLDLSALDGTVAPQSAERLRDLMDFARLFWPTLCGHLALSIGQEDLLALDRTLEQMHALRRDDWTSMTKLVTQFHYNIAIAFHNDTLLEVSENFLRELALYPSVHNWSLLYHGLVYYFDLLLLALRNHESEQAAAVMADYLRHSAEYCYAQSERAAVPEPPATESAAPEA